MSAAPENLDPIIGQLVARRRALRQTASQVSLRCGFSDSLLATYEAGRRHPNPRHLRRWANELGVDIILVETGGPS